MDRFAFTEKLGLANIFPTVHGAVEFIISEGDPSTKPQLPQRPSTALDDEISSSPATIEVEPKLQKDAKKTKNYAQLDD
jgi:hypothetical protein